jgi:aminoglycoside phosphotransferase (APT) family kinase protein
MNMDWNDKAIATRPGEELPISRLEACLLDHLPNTSGPLTIKQFPGGYSNLTYLISMGDTEYVLRRPPVGAKVKSGHDMGREYRILSGLKSVDHKVPTPFYYTEDLTIIGSPFYVMERVRGVILRHGMPQDMYPKADKMKKISTAWLDTLIRLHQVDPQQAGLGDLGRPQGYVDRQISGWGKRYYQAKTDDFSKIDFIIKWLNEHQITSRHISLIHNDFKYDNLILNPDDWTKVSAVLDWEMATLGDPLMDLGTSLGYWVNPSDPDEMKDLQFSPTHLAGNLTREEIIHQYELKTGRIMENPVFYYVYGLLKIAVIIQQIYYRYQQGLTQDPRFASLPTAMKQISLIAEQAIKKNKIDNLI